MNSLPGYLVDGTIPLAMGILIDSFSLWLRVHEILISCGVYKGKSASPVPVVALLFYLCASAGKYEGLRIDWEWSFLLFFLVSCHLIIHIEMSRWPFIFQRNQPKGFRFAWYDGAMILLFLISSIVFIRSKFA